MVVSSTVESSSGNVPTTTSTGSAISEYNLFLDSPEIQRELRAVEERSGIPWDSLPAAWWGDAAPWPKLPGSYLWDDRGSSESDSSGSDNSESGNDSNSGALPAPHTPRRRRFLFFSLRNEACAGVAHTRTSLACQLSVARALRRTLLVDASKCTAPEHERAERAPGGDAAVDVEASTLGSPAPEHERARAAGTRRHVQPLFAYFDLARVSLAPMAPLQLFAQESAQWGERNGEGAVGVQGEQMKNGEEWGNGENGENGTRARRREMGEEMHGQAERLTAAIAPESATLEDLLRLSEPVLLVRQAATGFADCEDPRNGGQVASDWSAIEYRPELWAVVGQIIASMDGGDYDAVHVRRGDKARDTSRWPNLAQDTSVEALAQKLPRLIPPGRSVYIASDESPSFFDPLRASRGGQGGEEGGGGQGAQGEKGGGEGQGAHGGEEGQREKGGNGGQGDGGKGGGGGGLYRVHMLGDYAHLWGEGSDWGRAQLALMEGQGEVAFDSYMEAIVDYSVFAAARRRVETFNDITTDPRNGISL
ncbi:unnamed protein product [Closterium sp. Yama58-4]|nr:unnamed protein product [Closterium sp. Yama58-4]